MAGKKRKLKKELKRKLRKEVKKKETKADERKVEKQVYDNQTLQQLMMAQMMSSRARVSNGEGTGWISAQNQANADRIQYQQQINAKEKEAKEWKRKAENIEENKKYKDVLEKYNRSIEDSKTAIERLKQLEPLEEELNQLKREKEKLEKDLENIKNDPVKNKELEVEDLQTQIKYLKERIKKSDPDDKKTMDEIANAQQLIDTLNKYKQRLKELDKVNDELKKKEAEMKSMTNNIREQIPEELRDKIKGMKWNAKNRDELIMELTHTITMAKDELYKQHEMLKETSNEMKTLNQMIDTKNKYEENMMREHPHFKPILDAQLSQLGENRTLADETDAYRKALYDYGGDLGLGMFYLLEGYAAMNKNADIRMTENIVSEMMDREREKNPLYKSFTDRTTLNSYIRDDIMNMIRRSMMGNFELSPEATDNAIMSIAKGKLPSYVEEQPIYPRWVNEFSAPLTHAADAVNEITKNYSDEVSVAQFGPGRE